MIKYVRNAIWNDLWYMQYSSLLVMFEFDLPRTVLSVDEDTTKLLSAVRNTIVPLWLNQKFALIYTNEV